MARRNGHFDILHIHDWLAASAAKSLKDAYGWPLVVSIHDTALGKNQGRLDKDEQYVAEMEGWVCEHAAAVLANSEFIRQELIQAYRVPKDKITVVGCGVNPESFRTESDAQLFKTVLCSAHEPLVAFVGRLTPTKGPHVLLEAVPRVLGLRPETRFVFAGDGQMREGLESRARELGLEGTVRFVGHLRGQVLATFYRAADLVVVPSLYEPFGMVALEAAVCGTPVLVAGTGGLSEILVDGVTGITVPPNDPEALARGIVHLLHNLHLGRELAAHADARVREQYRWEDVARRTMAVYERLVS
jgi:glycogen(starch) synthase